GFLAKYAMFLWLTGFGMFLWIDQPSRRFLRSPWLWSSILIALLFTTPVFVWNAQHHWASFFHVQRQTGTGFKISNPIEFVTSQAAILGGIFITLVGAIVYYFRREGQVDPNRRAMTFLVTI